jgi:hypothetical protein
MQNRMSSVSLDYCAASNSRPYCRKIEEYIADFCVIARRVLDEPLYQIFRYHFVLRAGWKLSSERLKLDKVDYFYRVYRIEAILGRAFQDMEPYRLYPVTEYFGGTSGVPYKPTPPSQVKRILRRPATRQEPDTFLQKIA